MTREEQIQTIARVAHEINAAISSAQGDDSHKPWDETPQHLKDSSIDGVKFHLSNPTVTPEQSHENWMKYRKKHGWKFGKKKDIEKKTHPLMVPYEKLKFEDKVKDYVFKQVVESLDAFLV